MRKVFISQPMNGKTQEDIISARIQAQEIVEKELGEKVEVLDSFFEDFSGDALESLSRSISLLAKADVAYFVTGWENSRGCKIEHDCAVQYGIPVMT